MRFLLRLAVFCWIIWVMLLLPVASGVLFHSWLVYEEYRTSDVSFYGDYSEAVRQKEFEKFMGQLFPEKLEGYFENIEYSCVLNKSRADCNEVFLSFSIAERDDYISYKQSVLGDNTTVPFYYEEGCEQFAVFDCFHVETRDENERISISYVQILKVIFCDENQTVTYIAVYSPFSYPVQRTSQYFYFEKYEINIAEGYQGAFEEYESMHPAT